MYQIDFGRIFQISFGAKIQIIRIFAFLIHWDLMRFRVIGKVDLGLFGGLFWCIALKNACKVSLVIVRC